MSEKRLELLSPPEFRLTPQEGELLSKADQFAKEFFIKAEQSGKVDAGGHGYDHNQRVTGMAASMQFMKITAHFCRH